MLGVDAIGDVAGSAACTPLTDVRGSVKRAKHRAVSRRSMNLDMVRQFLIAGKAWDFDKSGEMK